VNIHPELGLHLVQAKADEARIRAQRAALGAAAAEKPVPGVTEGTRGDRLPASMLARLSRSRRRSLRASAPRTMKG
jgi:hypothetical protein